MIATRTTRIYADFDPACGVMKAATNFHKLRHKLRLRK